MQASLSSTGYDIYASFENHPGVGLNHVVPDPSKPYFPVYYNDVYEVILPPNHRFPMEKYGMVRKLFQQKLQSLLTEETTAVVNDLRVSPLASWEELVTTHSPEYVYRFLSGDQTTEEIRNVGFPWSTSGVQRALSSTGGTVAAACAVCDVLVSDTYRDQPVWSAHVAGGTHHAFADRGEGFCVFNDIAVAANVVLERYPSVIRRVLILDLDVHQGNGSAVLFAGRDDVFTFSLHCSANHFSKKETSDLDIELPADATDPTYLVTLRHWLKQLEQEGPEFDLVFFQAGVDILDIDRLGRLSVSPKGVRRRNQLVFDFCSRNGLPVVITMGGGYPQRGEPWDTIIEEHANVYFGAFQHLLLQTQSEPITTD